MILQFERFIFKQADLLVLLKLHGIGGVKGSPAICSEVMAFNRKNIMKVLDLGYDNSSGVIVIVLNHKDAIAT